MGYLICDKCGGSYELQSGESPEDFDLSGICGGTLKFNNNVSSLKLFDEDKPEIIFSKKDLELIEYIRSYRSDDTIIQTLKAENNVLKRKIKRFKRILCC